MQRFPMRTLVLMGLALLSFMWMWWNTHRATSSASSPIPVMVVTDGGLP